MLSWRPWQGGARDWDAELARFPDHAVSQSYGWGEHKSRFGWTPHRIAACADGGTVAMAQVLVRRFPMGVAVAWAPGGPVGEIETWGPPFREAVARTAAAHHLYLRINPMRGHEESDSNSLLAAGWSRPRHPMLSGQSVLLDLRAGNDAWRRSIDANHRYSLRKSTAAGLSWVHGNTDALRTDFAVLCERLRKEKGIRMPDTDVNAVENLGRCMPESVLILVGYRDYEPVTGCLVLIQQATAFYATAATVGRGREVSAAYSMLAELRDVLRKRKIASLDFGGIDSTSETARGVYHFKRGFGGSTIRYLGEWDWATSSLLGLVADALIGRRGRGLG